MCSTNAAGRLLVCSAMRLYTSISMSRARRIGRPRPPRPSVVSVSSTSWSTSRTVSRQGHRNRQPRRMGTALRGQPDRCLSRHQAVPAALRDAALASAHGSAIVNLASTAGLVGSTQDPLYSMTKGGVTLFTKSAALEFARKGYRIRVNSMHPGTIDTDMGDQVLVTRARNLGTNDIEAARRQVIERLPIGRMGTPNDIAKGIVFLASDDAAFMTGAGLVIDGGITAQ